MLGNRGPFVQRHTGATTDYGNELTLETPTFGLEYVNSGSPRMGAGAALGSNNKYILWPVNACPLASSQSRGVHLCQRPSPWPATDLPQNCCLSCGPTFRPTTQTSRALSVKLWSWHRF